MLTYLGNRRNLSEKLRSSNSPNVLRNSPLIINVHWPLFNSTLNRAADQAKQIQRVPENWKNKFVEDKLQNGQQLSGNAADGIMSRFCQYCQ